MKRLINKNNSIETREYIIPTTPIYNPLGEGNLNEDEFLATDNKSYTKMINKEHKEHYWRNEE